MADDVNCREASRLLSLGFDRRLSATELEALAWHMERCRMCRDFESQLRFIHQAAERFRSGD